MQPAVGRAAVSTCRDGVARLAEGGSAVSACLIETRLAPRVDLVQSSASPPASALSN